MNIYEKELSDKIIGASFKVYNVLGNGFLEKVYENALMHELRKNNIYCESQVPIKVIYDNVIVGEYYADIFIEKKIILELKVCKEIIPIHEAQLLNYLKATKVKLGYIINFGNESKLEFKRMIL